MTNTTSEDIQRMQQKPNMEQQTPLESEIVRLSQELELCRNKLKASEEFVRIICNYLNSCEFFTSPEGKLIYITPSCETMTGYTKQNFYEDDKLLNRIIVEEDLEFVATRLRRALTHDDESGRFELLFKITRRDGKIRHIKQISQKVYSNTEERVYLGRRASNFDVTDLFNTQKNGE